MGVEFAYAYRLPGDPVIHGYVFRHVHWLPSRVTDVCRVEDVEPEGRRWE